jgi:hypothetical protein
MKQDYTHITVILDRSGSMESIRDDIIGGFNVFLDHQKAESGLATLTLAQFDTQNPYEIIHDFKLLAHIPALTRETFVPRAATPLLDAIGRGINDLESGLAKIQEQEKPARVVIVIITDGQENSSREFKKDQIDKMIKDKQEKNDWQFVFLSSDLAAVDDAIAQGFSHDSTMSFDASPEGTRDMYETTTQRISMYRSGLSDKVSFTEEDRAKQNSEKKRK